MSSVRRASGPGRLGFTMLEVMVALAIGAVVVLGARLIFESLSAVCEQIADASRSADADANGERLLRALVLGMEVGLEDSTYFQGNETSARFTTWCNTAGGWLERCRVSLTVVEEDSTSALVASFEDGTRLTLLRDYRRIDLRFLENARQGGNWFSGWGAGPTTPQAIGIVRHDDTLIVRIGERG